MPAGASPGALGATRTSRPSNTCGSIARQRVASDRALSYCAGDTASPASIIVIISALSASRRTSRSYDSDCATSRTMMVTCAAASPAKSAGNVTSRTFVPDARNRLPTSSNSVVVSGRARSHSNVRHTPMRGASDVAREIASSSRPLSAAAKSATSGTLRANPPTVSSVSEISLTPTRQIVPNVGLYPTAPQYAAGRTIEPAVCVPNASGTIQSATAAADPDDDPPGVCCRFRGLRVGPGWKVANSVVTVLPTTIAPAALATATQAASHAGRWLA